MTDTAKGMPLSKLAMNPPVTFEIRIKPMTNTAKPQRPFPEKITAVLDAQHDRDGTERFYFSTALSEARGEFDVQLIGPRFFARLLQEAEDIHHETSLTPRQLLERVRELEGIIERCAHELRHERCTDWYPEGANNAANHMSDCMANISDELLAALTKHGEGV